MNNERLGKIEKSDRIELSLSNVSVGLLSRIKVNLDKSLNIDDFTFKMETKSVIINNVNIIDEAERIIKSIDEKILITRKTLKNVYRHIYYLKNLDCANCASKVERICSRNIVNEKVIVDFNTLKIIIETHKEYEERDLVLKIQECAEQVDPRIEVKKTLKEEKTEDEFRIDKKKKFFFAIGLTIFSAFFIAKMVIFHILKIDEPWVYIMIYAGYVPAYIILAKDILYGAYKNIRHARFFDEMFLMALATVVALCIGYYDEALFLVIFYTICEMCQQYAINYSRKSIAGLASLKTEVANVEINGQKVEMSVDGIVVGDIIYVTAGEKVALDGVIIEGTGLLDNKVLTGESLPVEVKAGSEAYSGAVCIDGAIKIRVTKTYENSMVAQILGVVENASTMKSKSETFISKFAKYYTPFIVLFAVIIAVFLPMIAHEAYTLDWAGYRESIRVAMIFLVVSCPCALVISIPLGFFGGIGTCSKNGILVKGSNYLESLINAKIVVFDKTGTLTKGSFAIKEIVSLSNYKEEDILKFAAYAETTSKHVIAQSIIKAYNKPIDITLVTPIVTLDKRGISALVKNTKVMIGRKSYLEGQKVKTANMIDDNDYLYVVIDDVIAGYLVIEDEIKENAYEVVNSLKDLGIKQTIMITGDSTRVAKDVQSKLGIDNCFCEMNPVEKVDILQKIKEANPNDVVVFVGDGINDAPVISAADVGIAIGGLGTDATEQIADIVLINDDLSKLIDGLKIAKKTKSIIWQNIVFALLVKLVFLVMAPFNIINDILIYGAIFADVGVSLLAVLNSLRTLKYGKNK